MNQQKHSLDDFLKKQVEEADFAYREDYWNQMSAILDEEEKKKKYPFFWRGLSIVLVLLTVGGAAYLLPKLSTKKHETVSAPVSQSPSSDTQTTLPSVNQDLPQENSSNNTATENTSTQNNTVSTSNQSNPNNAGLNQSANSNSNTQPTGDTPTNSDNINSAQQRSSSSQVVNSNSDVTDKPTQVESKKQANKKSLRRNSRHANSSVASHPTQQNSSNTVTHSANANPIASSTATTSTTTNTDIAKNTPSTRTNSNRRIRNKKEANQNDIAKASKNKKDDDSKSAHHNDTDKTDVQHQANPSVLSSSNQVSTVSQSRTVLMKPIDTSVFTRPRRDESVYNPRFIASLHDYIPTKLDSVTVITYQSNSTSAKENIPVPSISDNNYEAASYKFRLMMIGGLNANKGLKGNVSNSLSWGFSPYIGVGIDRQLTNRLTLSSHIGFTYFNGLNSQYIVNSYQYGFGLDSSTVSILHKKLLQLYLPFSMYYRISGNHYLLAAIGASYGMDVSSQVKETSMSNNAGWGSAGKSTSTSTTTNSSGYRSGFNQFDMYAQLGYAYRVMNQLMIQASVQQGFFDMTKNSYFKNTQQDTQTRLSIGIKYNFKRN